MVAKGEWIHLHSNMLKISPPKTESFQIKILIFFIFLLKTWIACTRWNCLREMVVMSTHNLFLNINKKNNVYPCKPQFYYIKVGFKGVKII